MKKIFKHKIMKELFRYSKSRVIVLLYSTTITALFVDYYGIKFWKFAIWFVPISFIIQFFINRRVFNHKTNKEKLKERIREKLNNARLPHIADNLDETIDDFWRENE